MPDMTDRHESGLHWNDHTWYKTMRITEQTEEQKKRKIKEEWVREKEENMKREAIKSMTADTKRKYYMLLERGNKMEAERMLKEAGRR